MLTQKKGEKWVRLLRNYSPVGGNEAMQAETVDSLSKFLGISKLAFTHPARQKILDCFPETGSFRNIVLTGTAGDGKTSLCIDLVKTLEGTSSSTTDGIKTIQVETADGPKHITLIYDVTAWRNQARVRTSGEDLAVLTEMAASVYGDTNKFFVLAVNDGQMHELFRSLPIDTSENVRRLEKDLIALHAQGVRDQGERLRLINLSHVRSEEIMALCLDAILQREEWKCFEEEPDNPLFAEGSSLRKNFMLLNTPELRAKLLMFAQIADMTGYHFPIRGVFCLLANGLLGHPDAKDGVIRPGKEAAQLLKKSTHYKAALHRTLFGENLRESTRNKRSVYRFFSMLHIGEETTNDLDELFVFGTRDSSLTAAYDDLVAPDQFDQRNPQFHEMLNQYIRGDLADEGATETFLSELAVERRRVFLYASLDQLEKYHLWQTTVFHHAGEYIKEILIPLEIGKRPARPHLRKIASGLNRIWTGLLLAENANEIYFATGLDLTTSPVSDILLRQADINGDEPALEIALNENSPIPNVILSTNGRSFTFRLTLPRYEFLCRVADGAMPSSFSRESSSDFMSLKQRCLRDLGIRASTHTLNLIEVQDSGIIHKRSIHFAE
ncbi:hypothetical protein RGU70_02830 [Herbaspirillum sp. RTI4]|uniref:hypothetical protein n=1 Tax=Herbaspirillum sp. RTI4 TaxID=3048640 RepID=UPI002AB3DF2D|nr:hypothetical protein [Herbaspirillum sp. RTI4]MDY7577264.1 hypothetical protein [Herbaspirillum sp. RTI4]MEA9980554.1 hypothetical protein [Herbaspirillum sp. RTI4]